ncbi:MAG: metallophosphoesterase [Candidatus Delongbacteria bacterium]
MKNMIATIVILTVSLLIAQDGPYLLYYHSPDSVISISTDLNGTVTADTLETPEAVRVQIPGKSEFFEAPVRTVSVEKQWKFEEPEKLFAISDIEGNYDDFITILTNNGIIDENLNWSFDKGHLVLNGDMVDRGEFVTQVLWLVIKLEVEAEKSGGKVHYLLGNHDIMLMQGDTRYAVEKYHDLAKKTGRELKDYFATDTYFGSWMRGKNAVEKIGSTVFIHGGLSDSLLTYGISIEKINDIARRNIDVPDSLLGKEADLIFGSFGPFWYRGLVTDNKKYDKIKKKELKKILAYYDADRIVVGHCVVDEVSEDFKGKVVRIDVDHYEAGSCGIFIENGKVYKAMKSGERKKLK